MIVWENQMMTGVEDIDREHRELIGIVNELYSTMMEGREEGKILSTIHFLEKYIVLHFNHEEKIQLSYAYPFYHEHKQMHKDFIRTFHYLKHEIESEPLNPKMANRLNMVCMDWLKDHIGKEDKKVGEFITKDI